MQSEQWKCRNYSRTQKAVSPCYRLKITSSTNLSIYSLHKTCLIPVSLDDRTASKGDAEAVFSTVLLHSTYTSPLLSDLCWKAAWLLAFGSMLGRVEILVSGSECFPISFQRKSVIQFLSTMWLVAVALIAGQDPALTRWIRVCCFRKSLPLLGAHWGWKHWSFASNLQRNYSCFFWVNVLLIFQGKLACWGVRQAIYPVQN